MNHALRLDDRLVKLAKAEGLLFKRTTPKQIEYWADLGRQLSNKLTPAELIAFTQGIGGIHIESTPSPTIDADALFAEVESSRNSGKLSANISDTPFQYEASTAQAGLLDRVSANGARETGSFYNGQFIPQS